MAIQSGSVSAAVVLFIPSDRSDEGIGYFSMMTALATGVGPLISISVIYACFASLAVAFVLLAFVNSAPMLIIAAALYYFMHHSRGALRAADTRDQRTFLS